MFLFSATSGAAPTQLVPERLVVHLGQLTYVDFWASWCAPCAQAFPWLEQMQGRYGEQGFRVVGVGLDQNANHADRFLKRFVPGFAIVLDPEGTLATHYGVEGMPYGVLLDGRGNVIYRHTGFREDEAEKYENIIKAALAAKKGNE